MLPSTMLMPRTLDEAWFPRLDTFQYDFLAEEEEAAAAKLDELIKANAPPAIGVTSNEYDNHGNDDDDERDYEDDDDDDVDDEEVEDDSGDDINDESEEESGDGSGADEGDR
eukprot:g711.t1